MKEKRSKLDKIINAVEGNLEYGDLCRYSDNCSVYAYVGNRKKVKNIILKILGE